MRKKGKYDHLFPITIKGVLVGSFGEIDRVFNLPRGYAYKRYVRNGLRGDSLVRPVKKTEFVLSRVLSFRGVRKSVKRWLEENGIKTKTFYHRYYECGWKLRDSVNVKVGITTGRTKTGRMELYKGKYYRAVDLARMAGMSPITLLSRLRAGWSVEKSVETENRLYKPTVQRCDKGKVVSETAKLCKEYGVPYNRVISRLNAGWSMQDALTRHVHDRTVDMQRRRTQQLSFMGIVS